MTQNSDAEGAKRYYQEEFSSGGSYYLGDEETKGIATWGGRGAGFLGLKGDVKQRDFEALCENRYPDNEARLTARHRAGRTVGYDLTFNAPKSATLLYEIGGDEKVLKAFDESVDETMLEIEADALTRVRVNGKNEERQTANLTWAQFNHFTTRPVKGKVDPHLHAHVFTFNATYDTSEGKWKAVQFREINRDMPYYQANFQNRFAAKLDALGYQTEQRGKFFEISGISRHSIERFSNRTAEIEARAKELGLKTAEAKAKLGATTRAEKGELPGIDSLRTEWTNRLSETELQAIKEAKSYKQRQAEKPPQAEPQVVESSHGWEPYQGWDDEWSPEIGTTFYRPEREDERVPLGLDEEFEPDGSYGWAPAPKPLSAIVEDTLGEMFERSSVLNERRVKAAIFEKHLGRYSELEVEIALSERDDIESKEYRGQPVIYSKEELYREGRLQSFVEDGTNQYRPMAKTPNKVKEYSKLSPEQNRALRHVLLSSDRVIAIGARPERERLGFRAPPWQNLKNQAGMS